MTHALVEAIKVMLMLKLKMQALSVIRYACFVNAIVRFINVRVVWVGLGYSR